MSTTALEALQNAQINFETLGNMGLKSNPFFVIAKNQLDNGIEALENGMKPDDIIQEGMGGDVKTSP